VRAAAALLAWLLACHSSHHTAVTAARLQRQAALHTAAATAAAAVATKRQSLDALSSAKLQALAVELRRGAEQAEHAVNMREQLTAKTSTTTTAAADYSDASAAV
jgi:hypothetical protein